MGPRDIDALTSSTLKHLRERWWDPDFTGFLEETLQPKPGHRILNAGCGVGSGEVHLGRLGVSQLRLFGVDLILDRVRRALEATRGHNVRARFAAADVRRLPFADGTFDATFCVAVLQHVTDLASAVREMARVTRAGGRVLAVEPDNAARYWFSSSEQGSAAFELATRFFAALETRDGSDPALGPKLSTIFAMNGVEPARVRLFPVTVARLGAPPPGVWDARRTIASAALARVTDAGLREVGHQYLAALDGYAADAVASGRRFVEIQNTMLFATVGQKHPAAAVARQPR